MRRDKLLEEQLVRLDALYEYAKMHGDLKKVSTPNGEERKQQSPLKTIHRWRIHRDSLRRREGVAAGGAC